MSAWHSLSEGCGKSRGQGLVCVGTSECRVRRNQALGVRDDRPDIESVWFEQYRALVGQESH